MPKIKLSTPEQRQKLDEFVADYTSFTKKWSPPKVAGALGITKQALYYRSNKSKVDQSISQGVNDTHEEVK